MLAALDDAGIMIGRSLTHARRALDTLLIGVLLPVLLLLLFVYVFGGAIAPDGRYLTYVVPGIVLLCAGYGAATHRRPGRQRHDDRRDRPVPVNAHPALGRPDRTRHGEPGPQSVLHPAGASGGLRDRLPPDRRAARLAARAGLS